MQKCPCVFPGENETELVTISGEEPGTAWRVYVDSSADAFVRLQHLGHDEKIGWYVQKTVVLPRDVVAALVPQLRKALCLMPQNGSRQVEPTTQVDFMRLVKDAEQAA